MSRASLSDPCDAIEYERVRIEDGVLPFFPFLTANCFGSEGLSVHELIVERLLSKRRDEYPGIIGFELDGLSESYYLGLPGSHDGVPKA